MTAHRGRLDGGALYFLRRRRDDAPAPLRCTECQRPAEHAWTALRAAGWLALDGGLRTFRCPDCAAEAPA